MTECRQAGHTRLHHPYCTGSEQPDEEREVDVLDALADTPDGLALLAGHQLLPLVVDLCHHLLLPGRRPLRAAHRLLNLAHSYL